MEDFISTTCATLTGKAYTEICAIIYKVMIDDELLKEAITLAKQAGANALIDVKAQPIMGAGNWCLLSCTAVRVDEEYSQYEKR